MSDVQRRITMLWDSRGASQVRASIGQMSQGMQQYRRELRGVGQEQGYLDKQMRAFGTTMRYALAGGAIFGTVNAIRTLGEYQAKLGEISAIASQPGFEMTGKRLDDLGARLMKVSTETATPIAQLQEGVLNLYSTIGEVPEDDAARMMEVISKVARTSQADITDTTQALLGLINAFGEGTDAIPKFGDQFFKVVQLSAGGVDFARTYAQQLGRLSQGAKQGGFSPEQMGALAIGSSRFGGSTATNLRGLAQLERTIRFPSNKATESALASIGLPQGTRINMSGWDVLMKVLREANARGISGAGRGSTAAVDEFGDQASNAQLGLSGQGALLLSKIFTRAESRNMAAIFSQLLTPEQVQGTKNLTLDQYLAEVTDSAGAADKAMDKAMDMRRIQQAGNAMQNFSIAFANAFSPVFNPAARGITAGSSAFQNFAEDNPLAVMLGTGALGAALFTGRMMSKRVTLGGAARGLSGIGAAADLMSGGAMRGDSPVNPLYVVVVSQLTGPGGMFSRGKGQYPSPIGPAPAPGGGSGGVGKWGKFAPLAGWLPAAVGLAVLSSGGGGTKNEKSEIQTAFPRMNRLWNRVAKGFPLEKLSPVERQAMESMGQYSLGNAPQPRLRAAESMLDKAVAAGAHATVTGKATVTVNVDSTDAKGNTERKTVKVPVGLFGGFTPPAPQTGGKNKTTRGK